MARFLFTTESAEIFGAGGYPLLEKLRKTFLLGVGAWEGLWFPAAARMTGGFGGGVVA